MSGYLLDTNVVSEIRRGDRAAPAVVRWLSVIPADDMRLSTITLYELYKGALAMERRDPVQGHALRVFVGGIVVGLGMNALPVTTQVAMRAAALMVPDKRSVPDVFIAATALEHDLTLVTRNVADFQPIPGLRVLNPWE